MQAKGLMHIEFPLCNVRSFLAQQRREHFSLDACFLLELSFSNFQFLYSSRSGVTCHP